MEVYDKISLGDTLALNLQYDKAEEAYLSAKALSAKIYFDRGRDDAMAALEKLYSDMKDETAAGNDAAQAKAEDQTAATSVLAEGDASFAKGDYEGAKVYYTTALQKYTALEDDVQVTAIQQKLAVTEEKLAHQKELEAEAESYMVQAQTKYEEKDYVPAKKYYLLAKDIYATLKNDDKVAEIGRKLELIEMGITEEEQAKKEAEAAEADRLEQERGAVSPAGPEALPTTSPTPDGRQEAAPNQEPVKDNSVG